MWAARRREGQTTPFRYDPRQQKHTARGREDHTRRWDSERDYRLRQSRTGRARENPRLLAVPPWSAWDWNSEPPVGDDDVLDAMRVLVKKYSSHYKWRATFTRCYDQHPDTDAWLEAYWNQYIGNRPLAVLQQEGFGPLGVYDDNKRLTDKCLVTKVGGLGPSRTLEDWSAWETEARRRNGRLLFDPWPVINSRR